MTEYVDAAVIVLLCLLPVTGFDLWGAVFAMGLVCTLYTSLVSREVIDHIYMLLIDACSRTFGVPKHVCIFTKFWGGKNSVMQMRRGKLGMLEWSQYIFFMDFSSGKEGKSFSLSYHPPGKRVATKIPMSFSDVSRGIQAAEGPVRSLDDSICPSEQKQNKVEMIDQGEK